MFPGAKFEFLTISLAFHLCILQNRQLKIPKKIIKGKQIIHFAEKNCLSPRTKAELIKMSKATKPKILMA